MALDYIIGGLQLLSAAINALALGAFWISPGLRTTANRFAINLLIANIVACISLTPAFWLNGGLQSHSLIETMAFLEPSDLERTHHTQPFDGVENRNSYDSSEPHHKYARDLHKRMVSTEDTKQPHLTDYRNTFLEIDRDVEGNIYEYIDQIDVIQEDPVALPTKVKHAGSENRRKLANLEKMPPKMDDLETVEEEREIAAESKNERESVAVPAYDIFTANALKFDCVRFWGFDFAASIGKHEPQHKK